MFSEALRTIETLFAAVWNARTPIAYTNGPSFDPPSDAAWVRITTAFGDGAQRSLGPVPLHRTPGVVTVQIFVPTEIGAGDATELGDAVCDIFRGVTLNTGDGVVRFHSPSMRPVGVSGVSWQLNVQIPFQRDFS